MVSFWYIKGDFLKERSRRIGASDIPALIPDPEQPTQSLAGYGRTPVTVWQEKTGRIEREPAGLAAEMGHYLEGKAIELFIRSFSGYDMAAEHVVNRNGFESMVKRFDDATAGHIGFQQTPYHHNTQFYRDGMIVHADAIYSPTTDEDEKITKHGVIFHTGRPALIEAKSATYWSAKRPEGSVVRGYDFNLKTWQGIPLKHYMQIQFQLALLEVDIAYLALLYNTSEFNVWRINANKKHQARLIDLAGKMAYHIEKDIAPGDMALNADDIMALYPDIGNDFVIVNDEEREHAIDIAKEYRQAEKQAKRWGDKKNDAKDAMAVMLRDRPELRDSEGIIAKWTVTKGSERIKALSDIKNNDLNAYKYLKRKGLIYTSAESRRVNISWRGEEE